MADKWEGAYAPVRGAITRTTSTGRTSYLNKGVQRARKERKRLEAETRNALTVPENRREFARSQGFARNSDRIASETGSE